MRVTCVVVYHSLGFLDHGWTVDLRMLLRHVNDLRSAQQSKKDNIFQQRISTKDFFFFKKKKMKHNLLRGQGQQIFSRDLVPLLTIEQMRHLLNQGTPEQA